MRIIIEGADLTGKSSITKSLEEVFLLSRVHVTSKDPNTFEFYNETLNKTDVVFDRHFIGEMIYPKVFKRKGNLGKESFEILLNKARELNYKIYIVTASEEELLKRLSLRGEKHKDVEDNLLSINKQFLAIAKEYNIEVIDTTFNNSNFITNNIIRSIVRDEEIE